MSGEYRTYYQVLKLEVTADERQVKAAYRRAARNTHPDHGGNAEEFRLVTEAYQTLVDPTKRAVYDRAYAPSNPGSRPFAEARTSEARPAGTRTASSRTGGSQTAGQGGSRGSSATDLPSFIPPFGGPEVAPLSLDLASRQIHGAPRKRGLFGAQARLIREARSIELLQQQILNKYPSARLINGLLSPIDKSHLDHLVLVGYRMAVVSSMMVPEGAYRWNGSTLVHGQRGIEAPRLLPATHALARLFPDCTVSAWIVVHSPGGNPFEPVIDYTRGNEPDGGPHLNVVGAARLGRELGSFLAAGDQPNTVDLQILARLLGGMY